MTAWNWGNLQYREHEDEPAWLMREALRRAVEIRDRDAHTRASGGADPLGSRPVLLVAVLNSLSNALGFEPQGDLWSDVGGMPDLYAGLPDIPPS